MIVLECWYDTDDTLFDDTYLGFTDIKKNKKHLIVVAELDGKINRLQQ